MKDKLLFTKVYAHCGMVCKIQCSFAIMLLQTTRQKLSWIFYYTGNFVFLTGSREQAFVYALSSAALAQSVAKACAMGIAKRCGCGAIPNEPPPGDWKWGGCGDNIAHGSVFSRVFTEAPYAKKKFSKARAVNIHNNRVGREVSDTWHIVIV